jgi:hypothetical protein
MTTHKGDNQRPKHPKPKNYLDYVKEAIDKGQLSPEDYNRIRKDNNTGIMFEYKKTYIKCR